MASGAEGTERLNYQTSVLKVSIHCEGCKKKVRKVLQGLEGVYAIDINSKQNKVTVTGNVDAESLIRRLVKYGKHAELWPETEKKTAAANSSGEAAGDVKEKVPAVTAAPKTEQELPNTEKKQQTEEGTNKTTPPLTTEAKATAPAAAVASAAISGEVIASKTNTDAPKSNDSDKLANSDKKASEKPDTAVEADASEEADVLKKKGRKAQRETSTIDERAVSDTEKVGNAAAAVSAPPPMQFPVYAQPVYSVSYSTVQPSTSYAYYSSSPAAMPSSFTYSDYPPPSAYSPDNYSLDPYYGSIEAPAASGGSYDIFNDENPNACNLM